MQQHDMAVKVRLEIDGIERKDLVAIEEISSEKGIVEVPEFDRKRKIADGVIDVPLLNCKFKIQRNSDTIKYFKDWYFNNQIKDVTKIQTDGHGSEFMRTEYPSCECAKYTETVYEGASPTYAQIDVILVPYDIIPNK
jgi:hypothetical protein